MISSDKLTDISYEMSQAFEEINTKYIKLMSEHVKAMGKLTATDMHRLEQMNKMNANIAEINKMLRKQCNLTLSELHKVYLASGLSVYEDAKIFYDVKGAIQVPFAKNMRIQQYIKSVETLTTNTFENLSRTTVFSKNYQKLVDRGIYAVSSGLEDYQSAIRKTLVKAATDGMRVTYASGRTRRLDSAVRMNVLSGVRQVNLGTRMITGEQYGADGYEISAHGLCAEDHLDIQGRQFTLKQFNNLQNSLKRPIGELNCQHTAYPIVMGISSPSHTPEELQYMNEYSTEKIDLGNGKEVTRYEASQLMRNLETNIRYAKDALTAGKASGDDVIVQRAKSKIKRNKELYSNIANKSGLQERPERMRIIHTKKINGLNKLAQQKNPITLNPTGEAISKAQTFLNTKKKITFKESSGSFEGLLESAVAYVEPMNPNTIYTQSYDAIKEYVSKHRQSLHNNATADSIIVHEVSHIIGQDGIDINIVNKAEQEYILTNEYKNKVKEDIMNKYLPAWQIGAESISKMATTTQHETFAEAMADVYSNKDKAKSFSKIIYKLYTQIE
jgi:DNA-binding phage protein